MLFGKHLYWIWIIKFLSDLLIHIDTSKLTEGNTTRSTSELQPHFNQIEVITTGNPETVDCPVGNGIRFTNEARVIYRFTVSKPWPCPFNINQCPTGFTLSFWFNWDYIVSSYYRNYINLGKTFSLYRANDFTKVLVSLRWLVDDTFSWYYPSKGNAGEWNLITWRINHTHGVGYLNGFKKFEKPKKNYNSPSDIDNELYFNKNLNTGNFSMGPMQLWAGGKSPVFIWRLFQEGLKN